ncbi:rhodanese-like domain-containing protein [Uliginosibacterium gangwonense]|uniref:rhodanese-like domain-containing protein n=1 Tax=Uliginosibacterium gangwonense TaxID=392736 RepID=UPI00036FAE92|nr:rhodanese-like domain-containing protein [Uliginosibacterium gangwonense]
MKMWHKLAVAAVLAVSALGASAKTVLIDVRTAEEFAAGHLDGARNIDYQVIAQGIDGAGVAKDDEVILYCRSGHRASIALETLKGMGYQHVLNYGGMEEARKRLMPSK